jgi:uncharacterized protein (TIGR02172 family)
VLLLELGELVGRGYQCDVFALGEGKVLKVFKPGADRSWIEREFAVTRLLHEAGLPIPAVFDIVEIDGRTGIVYERIHGPLLSAEVLANPGKVKPLARDMAELHAKIHSVSIRELPSQRERLRRRIGNVRQLAPEEREAVLRILDGLSDGDVVCHGDLNLNNVIVSPKGMMAIDWDNGCRGNPLADVARVVLLLNNAHCHFTDPSERAAIDMLARRFRDEYADAYFQLAGAQATNPATGQTADSTTGPAAAQTTDPTIESATDPATDPTIDLATDPAIDSTTDPTTDSTAETNTESTTGPAAALIARWIIPVATARLVENIVPEQNVLIETVRKGVTNGPQSGIDFPNYLGT